MTASSRRSDTATSSTLPRIPRRRTTFTVEQLYLLEMYFAQSQYVGCEERERLARILSLDEYQVKIWFQNRRIRMRREANK